MIQDFNTSGLTWSVYIVDKITGVWSLLAVFRWYSDAELYVREYIKSIESPYGNKFYELRIV